MLNWVSLNQGQWMTLIFDIHIGSCTHLFYGTYQFDVIDYNSFWKNPLVYTSNIKA